MDFIWEIHSSQHNGSSRFGKALWEEASKAKLCLKIAI